MNASLQIIGFRRIDRSSIEKKTFWTRNTSATIFLKDSYLSNSNRLLCLAPNKGHYKLSAICLSVCSSVCPVPRRNSRTDRPTKPKFCRMEAHHTGNSWTYLEFKRSKVTRTINAHTVNVEYLPNGKAYELHTWYTDGGRRPASLTNAVTSKVKCQGCKVTWRAWQVLADKNTKIGKKVVHPTGG